MRVRATAALLASAALTMTACVSGDRPVLIEGSSAPVAAAVEPLTTTTTTEVVKPPTSVAPAALGLVTPTGIVVPVLEDRNSSYLVRTPCGNEAELRFGTPLGQVDVVLDPGHGGPVETGAVGPNGLPEKDLNLRLAKRVAAELREREISVALTRTTDYRVPLAVRSEIGDTLGAKALVSIHHNAPIMARSDKPGAEMFIQQDAPESERLGRLMYDATIDALSTVEGIDWVSARDAGVILVLNRDSRESYGMIRRPETAAIIAEFGYLANPTEAAFYATDEYLDIMGPAVADALVTFVTTDEDGDPAGNRDPRRFNPSGTTGGSNNCVDPPLE